MLLEFSIGNFRSFEDIQSLDMRATALRSEKKEVDDCNILRQGNEQVLKAVGLYGPNGSGKSNVIKALQLFCQLVRSSLENEAVMTFAPEPFKLGVPTPDNAGFFQVQVLLDGKKFRYGFTLDFAGEVGQEWLFGPADKNETWYFKRTGTDIQFNKDRFDEADRLPLESVRPNTLFLSFVSSYNGPTSQLIRKFLATQIHFLPDALRRIRTISISGSKIIRVPVEGFETSKMVNDGGAAIVLDWLRKAGLHYTGIEVKDKQDGFSETILLEKQLLDNEGKQVGSAVFDLRENESAGTQKYFNLIAPLYHVFNEGGVIVSDEVDNNFHPSLLQQFIRQFNDPALNKAGAQLIFTSHDTNLLQPDILRRDQIYFTEKSNKEATVLYSLADLKGIRNNADFARQYLAGLYGALPILHNLKNETSLNDFSNG